MLLEKRFQECTHNSSCTDRRIYPNLICNILLFIKKKMLIDYTLPNTPSNDKKNVDVTQKKNRILSALEKRNNIRKKVLEEEHLKKSKIFETIDIVETTKKFLGEDLNFPISTTVSLSESLGSITIMNNTALSIKSKTTETKEDIEKRTQLAFVSWINQLCGVDKECCTDMESFTERARLKADEILRTSLSNQRIPQEPLSNFRDSPVGLSKKATQWTITLSKAKESLKDCVFLSQIQDIVGGANQICSTNLVPSSDVGLKNSVIEVLFNYNSTWLRLAIECIFDTELTIPNNGSLRKVITSYLSKNFFSNPKILKSKRLFSDGKNYVTPSEIKKLQRHFITKFIQIIAVIEYFQTIDLIIPRNPPMFEAKSIFCTSKDVITWLRKTIISVKFNLTKALEKIGLSFCYEQKFYDTYVFVVKDLSTDLCDGIILAKVIETILKITDNSLISSLRQPRGDRIKKLGNVRDVLEFARNHNLDIGNIKAEDIVQGNITRIIEMLWKIVGVFEAQKDEYVIIRQFSKKIEKLSSHLDNPCLSIPNYLNGFDIVIHLCKQFALLKGLEIPKNIEDFTDGCLLYNIYDYFCSKYERIPSCKINGTTLLKKVFNIGYMKLGIPSDLTNYAMISLKKYKTFKIFIKLFIEKCFVIMECNESALIITRVIRRIGLIKHNRLINLKEYSLKWYEEHKKNQIIRNNCAIKIQSLYKGYIIRKKLNKKIIERKDKINKMKKEVIDNNICDIHDLSISLVDRFNKICEVLMSMKKNECKKVFQQLVRLLHLSTCLGLYFVKNDGHKFLCLTINSLRKDNCEEEIYLLFGEIIYLLLSDKLCYKYMKDDIKNIVDVIWNNIYDCIDHVNAVQKFGNCMLLLGDREDAEQCCGNSLFYIREMMKKLPPLLSDEICHMECNNDKNVSKDCKIYRMVRRLHSSFC
ncbi:Abnormal spindle-like microcephaly-associated protein [Strongyloides ratti]|uniref:Abnormal spindle-like microcephaly-associated protein n=1 Tax=Strongyloides ratti TaxID=34506 RepID=A0A090L640_STRRB|nr:Abnormal spindle-like microcephaly-associated protein [Strongyloides ratti]CEF65177.1 Abnormal spindle-like microcephaly-associated protein [Strongyloides ratti]